MRATSSVLVADYMNFKDVKAGQELIEVCKLPNCLLDPKDGWWSQYIWSHIQRPLETGIYPLTLFVLRCSYANELFEFR